MDHSRITHQFSRTTNRILANSLIVLGVLLWIWVQITYYAKHPEKAELTSQLWTGQWVSTLFAIVLSITGWTMRRGGIVTGPLRQSRINVSD